MRDNGCSRRFAVTMTRSSSSEPDVSAANAHAGASRHETTKANEDEDAEEDMTRKLRKNCHPFTRRSRSFWAASLKDRSPLGNSRSLSTPRLIDGRRRQAGLLARGLESAASPSRTGNCYPIQWSRRAAHHLQLRGQ